VKARILPVTGVLEFAMLELLPDSENLEPSSGGSMVELNRTGFARRSNLDGTRDSICKKCFATIVTSQHESELTQAEQAHACDPHVLNYWNQIRQKDVGV
jgi:hypothetical protein